ncbi:MAG: SEC-C domain-containing protein [Acidimicrobiia bacterium]|nr:SEC-C domain-containing protein [Acidimicrobiia bacterium]
MSERHLMGGATRASKPGADGRKPGRNEPCFCGSGLEYKRCHGAPS